MYYLDTSLWFPPASECEEDSPMAIGGDLSPERLLLAYRSGIFPWFEDEQPILWWSPDPRMVLFPKELKVSKSLRKTINKELFTVTFNTSFSEVIRACSIVKREAQAGTWITEEMLAAYEKLHELGHAISVEVWQKDKLVGGLYGIDLAEPRIFCGESMFSRKSDASKVGFYHLVSLLLEKKYQIIDCQMYTDHLASLGAIEIPRATFLEYL